MNSTSNFNPVQIRARGIMLEEGEMLLVRYTNKRENLLIPAAAVKEDEEGYTYTDHGTYERAHAELLDRAVRTCLNTEAREKAARNEVAVMRDEVAAIETRVKGYMDAIKQAVTTVNTERQYAPRKSFKKKESAGNEEEKEPLRVLILKETEKAYQYQIEITVAGNPATSVNMWVPKKVMKERGLLPSWKLKADMKSDDNTRPLPQTWRGSNFAATITAKNEEITIERTSL